MAQQNAGQLVVVALIVGAAIGVALAVGALGMGAPDADSPDNGQPDGSVEPTDNQSPTSQNPSGQTWNGSDGPSLDGDATIEQFGTTDAFREYVRAGQRRASTGQGALRRQFDVATTGWTLETTAQATFDADIGGNGGESTATNTPVPDRIGNTNVQVEGLDEPDIVKTDGRNFYYSPEQNRYVVEPLPGPRVDEPGRATTDEFVPPREQQERETHVIDASEPADPAAISNIDANGEMLQTGDRLVVFDTASSEIIGYDVSDPENPTESWSLPLNSSLVTVRETGGQLYVVTRTAVGPNTECPIAPLGSDEAIACGDIYAPGSQTSADTAYTTFSIDAESGTVEDSVSMMGTGDNTVVYMSQNGLYVTYTTGITESELRISWAENSEAVPEDLADRIAEIDSYDISQQSKRNEMRRAVQQWSSSGDDGANLQQDYQEYRVSHQENLTQTTIVSVDVEDENLLIGESGTVPGEPLNQFALDEYEGTLRITTTIPRVAGQESDNHLYVLDSETLDRENRVTGMGQDQRVYSVRYVGDTAYVVTFRQVDPFYVIDFEEPTEPELLSGLKLPGFSSYLHPINDNYVLGIGEENGRVKSVLFDVTDPTDTSVADDIVLDEYTSAIDSSHHAFMIDRRHEVFFLPTGNSAKIIDYTDGELEVVKEVSTDEQVTRARYVEDSLYIFAGDEVIVLDQTNWERTTTLSLGDG
jgi:uncharacterized secreted protein with C-terminal beta-propeller domain